MPKAIAKSARICCAFEPQAASHGQLAQNSNSSLTIFAENQRHQLHELPRIPWGPFNGSN